MSHDTRFSCCSRWVTHMKGFLTVLIVAAARTFAQRSEIGAVAGFGSIAAEDVMATRAVAVGVEFCGLCSGRLGLFTEYSHLESVGNRLTNGICRFDIVAGGLRIQGGQRVRPFFDIGVAYGVDTFSFRDGSDTHGNPGVVLAGGAAIRLKDRLYIRPQFRLYGLRGLHFIGAGTAGVGVLF